MVKNFTYKTSNKIWTRVLVLLFLIVSLVNKSWGQVYSHNFGTTSFTATTYTVPPPTIDPNLSSSQWVSSTGSFTSLAGNGGAPSQALTLSNSSGTPSLTLTFSVAAGCTLDITSFNFWRQRSTTGAQNWTLTINGIFVGSGTVPTTGASIGTTAVANTVSGLTGNVSVVLSLSGASGAGTFRLDDFTLNGSTTCGGGCSAPTITISPTTQTVCAGSTATIGIGTSAASPNYTWQASANGSTGWANVVNGTPTGASYSGATTSTLSITAGATYYYRCLVTDGSSTCVATSGTSTLSVNTPPTITLSPVSKTVCETATNVTFTASASGTSPTYQWQQNTGTGFSDISGATTRTLTLASVSTAMNSYSYQCVISVSGCSSVTTTPVVLTVVSIPAAPPTPSVLATCNTAVISETVVGTPPAGVTWYWASNANAPTSFTSAVNDLSITASGTSTVYIRANSNLTTCWNSTVTTNSVVVTVVKSPTITTQPSSTVVCQGSTASIKVTMNSGSSTPLTYQWQENTGSGFTNITSGSPYTIAVGTYTSTLDIDGTKPLGTYTYQCIISNSCGTVTTGIVTVSVTSIPANDLCSNASAIVIDAGSVVGNLNCASPTAGLAYVPSRNDVWYVFTPTCTATHTVTMTFTTSGADYDLDIFNTGSCPASGTASFTAHGSTTVETIAQTFTSGVTYYIRVVDYNTSGGTFSINVSSTCGPPRTVTFNANGGSGTMSNQTANTATNLNTNTFTNSGCFFIAWNTAADGSGTSYANGAVYSFTADITLYAQWNCSGGSSFSCSGAIGNGKTLGCGDSSPCDLSTIGTYLDGVACTTTLNASCTGACDVQTPFSRQFTVPAGCTATITAEMKVRSSGCGNSGMDSGDLLAITNSGGSVISQTATLSNGGTVTGSSINKNSGTGNADGWAQMIITGGDITVSGSGQRGDEIVTYTVNFVGSCGSGCNTILPITLLDFYGVKKGNANELVWKITEESNIKRYVIEKSSNGIDFIYMTSVYPTEGSYNKTYRTEDFSPFSGITYYRLVTMENDFSLQYHKTIYLESNSKKWSYYYYQTDNSLNIEFKNALPEDAVMSLYDMSGQILIEERVRSSNAIINTTNIASGIYFIKISNPYKTENFKVVISK